jgi:hypothetical protein
MSKYFPQHPVLEQPQPIYFKGLLSLNDVRSILPGEKAREVCRKAYSDNGNTMLAEVNCYLVMSHVPVCCVEQWNGHYETRSSRVNAAVLLRNQVAQDFRSFRLVLVTDVSDNRGALVFSD